MKDWLVATPPSAPTTKSLPWEPVMMSEGSAVRREFNGCVARLQFLAGLVLGEKPARGVEHHVEDDPA